MSNIDLTDLSKQANEVLANREFALLASSDSEKLREYHQRIGAGGEFTSTELSHFKEYAALAMSLSQNIREAA